MSGRASPSRSGSTPFRTRRCMAVLSASRRRAARNSRCCRRTMPPAISPRSCSVSRSVSCSTRISRSWIACCRACRSSPASIPAVTASDDDLGPVSRGVVGPRPLCAVLAVLLAAFLANFDSRLTAVGLPDLRGAFSLGFDEGAWLSTSGIGSQIFIAPSVAWLATVFGLRRVLGIPSLLFALVSLMLPFVHDYTTLIAFSVVHGILLGMFVPATLMIIFRNLPIRWWVPAIALYAFRVGFAFNTSSSAVGFFVEHLGWRWIYWQGAVIAPLMGLMVYLLTPRELGNRRVG